MIIVIAHVAVVLGAVKILIGLAGISNVSATVRRSDVLVVVQARPTKHREPSGIVYYSDDIQYIQVPLASLQYIGLTVGVFVAICLALWALAAFQPSIPTPHWKWQGLSPWPGGRWRRRSP
jgi:hypothetical protein